MKTKYSKEPSFILFPTTGSPIYDVVLRLIANPLERNIKNSGTCSFVASNLGITAKHVIEDFLKTYGVSSGTANVSLWALQITNDESIFAVWEAREVWLSPHTDIALIHLIPYDENAGKVIPKQLSLDLIPPEVGSRVVGFGYHSRSGMSSVETNSVGGSDIKVNDEPYTTVGEVMEVYPERRDSFLLNFPSYRVNFKSKPGMSGGPVFNDDGKLCGLITTGVEIENGKYEVNVVSLWPLLGITINANRGGNYPRDIFYPVYELARDKIIAAIGWERVVLDSITNKISLKA